jgi:hypothetical protein
MVANLRHTVVSSKDEARLFVVVERREKLLRLLDNEIDSLDIVHVLL